MTITHLIPFVLVTLLSPPCTFMPTGPHDAAPESAVGGRPAGPLAIVPRARVVRCRT